VAESVMQQMRLSPQQKKVAISLFEKGKQTTSRCAMSEAAPPGMPAPPNLLQMFIEILIVTALATATCRRASASCWTARDRRGLQPATNPQILQRRSQPAHARQTATSATALNDATAAGYQSKPATRNSNAPTVAC